jgi:hypothetical protein
MNINKKYLQLLFSIILISTFFSCSSKNNLNIYSYSGEGATWKVIDFKVIKTNSYFLYGSGALLNQKDLNASVNCIDYKINIGRGVEINASYSGSTPWKASQFQWIAFRRNETSDINKNFSITTEPKGTVNIEWTENNVKYSENFQITGIKEF